MTRLGYPKKIRDKILPEKQSRTKHMCSCLERWFSGLDFGIELRGRVAVVEKLL